MSYHRRTAVTLAESEVLIDVFQTGGRVEMTLQLDDGEPPLPVNLSRDQQDNIEALGRVIEALKEAHALAQTAYRVPDMFSQATARAFSPAGPAEGARRGMADGID